MFALNSVQDLFPATGLGGEDGDDPDHGNSSAGVSGGRLRARQGIIATVEENSQ